MATSSISSSSTSSLVGDAVTNQSPQREETAVFCSTGSALLDVRNEGKSPFNNSMIIMMSAVSSGAPCCRRHCR